MAESQIDPEVQAEARRAAWYRGDLRYKLHDGQEELYAHFFASVARRIVWHCARRFGKSWLLCIIAITYALKHPKSVIVYAAPSREQVKQFIWPLMDEICADAPEECKPTYIASDHLYRFPNWSIIHIDGADDDRGDHLRGPKADLVIGDECGFWRYLKHVIRSVLGPRTLGIRHAKTILASSSPESVGHEFVGFIGKAKQQDAYCKKTIYDNPRLTQEEIDEFAEECGGYKSTEFRREGECELVTDETRSVVPEFDEARHVLEATRPAHFFAYEGMDLGLVDFTHVLYGYHDFERAKLVIEDETVTNYSTTRDLAEQIKAKELLLWGEKKPAGRYSDNDAQQLYDLSSLYNLHFVPALKADRDEAINRLRRMFQDNKIEINPRCAQLIHQLKVAIWNKQRTQFERLEGFGHMDGVAALVYLARMIDYNKNPVPQQMYAKSNIASETFILPRNSPKHELAKLMPAFARKN